MPEDDAANRFAVIGGGAAGFFAAIRLAELRPDAAVFLFEKSTQILGKVRVSGGGRCNVTHACFDPKALCAFYPRGHKELLGPFHRFGPLQTIEWFESRGVELKTEEDGRIFPVSDSSQSIIDALMHAARENGVRLHLNSSLMNLQASGRYWNLQFGNKHELLVNSVFIATGSSDKIWETLRLLDLKIAEPVPSLFTFHIHDKELQALSGLSIEKTEVQVVHSKYHSEGPLLFTHWGLSGPAILKTSSFEARNLKEKGYQFDIRINFIPASDPEEVMERLLSLRDTESRKLVIAHSAFSEIPKRAWIYLVGRAGIPENLRWADLSNTRMESLRTELTEGIYSVSGKSTFKEEFVTCGGVAREEIDFRRFESVRLPGLFFGGEVLDVDAVTGGFNFQHAWTSGWIAAAAMAER